MKKITIAALSAVLVLALCLPAMATDVDHAWGTADMGGAGATYDLSNNVYLDYSIDDPANAQFYGLSTVHSGGNRMFSTTSETSVIWWKTTAKGTTDPDSPWASL
jgi:hypothetical protein